MTSYSEEALRKLDKDDLIDNAFSLKVVVWCNSRKMSFLIKNNISKKVIKIHG